MPYRSSIVDEINGQKIRTLEDLARAFEQAADRFVIRMIGDGPPLVLDPKQVEAARERIKTRYNVLMEQNLDEQPAAKPAVAHKQQNLIMRHGISFSSRFWRYRPLRRRRKRLVQKGIRQYPCGAVQAKEVSLVRVNVTGQTVRLFSAVAKESAIFKARARRRSAQWSRARDGGPGGEPKLRRTGARRIGRKNRGQCRGGRLRGEPRFA